MSNLKKIYSMQRKMSEIKKFDYPKIEVNFIGFDDPEVVVIHCEGTERTMSISDFFLEQAQDKDSIIINLMSEDSKLRETMKNS